MHMTGQISDHDFLDDKQIRGAHATTIHPDNVGMVEASHDLEFMLWAVEMQGQNGFPFDG